MLIVAGAVLLLVLLSCCCGLRSCLRARAEKAPKDEPARKIGKVDLSTESATASLRLRSLAPEPDVLVPTPEQLAQLPAPKAARVVCYVPASGKPAAGGGINLSADQEAGLALLLQCAMPGDTTKNIYYSDAPTAKWGDTVLPPDRLGVWPEKDLGPLNIRWYKVEPADEKYNNGSGKSFKWDEIKYVRNRVPEWDNKWYVPVNVDPIQNPARLPGYGTMRYQVEVFIGTEGGAKPNVIASVGLEQAKKPWGIGTSVPRVSVRKDETYVGWIYAWGNVPYVYGSESPTERDSDHQAELFRGSDCCDTLVAAARALQLDVHYTYSGNIGSQAMTVIGEAKPDTEGRFISKGQPVPWGKEGVQAGDLVVMGPDSAHIVALLEDQGLVGTLDVEDTVIHHLNQAPSTETLARAWDTSVIHVYRWKFGG